VQVVITKSGATVSATVDGNAVNMSAVGTSAHALAPFTIINTRGFDLPQTGGTGNWLFPVIGLSMLAVCVTGIVILMKKKPAQE
jgi:LPXTG-motif cell wall-anchored protein